MERNGGGTRTERTEEETERYQIQVQFRRNPGGWETVIEQDAIGEGNRLRTIQPGSCCIPSTTRSEMVFEPFGQTWARFFPSVPTINGSPIAIRSAVGEVLGPLLRTG